MLQETYLDTWPFIEGLNGSKRMASYPKGLC